MECSTPKYLCHENREVRLNAIATVVSLMRPAIPAPCTSANQTTVRDNKTFYVVYWFTYLESVSVTCYDVVFSRCIQCYLQNLQTSLEVC